MRGKLRYLETQWQCESLISQQHQEGLLLVFSWETHHSSIISRSYGSRPGNLTFYYKRWYDLDNTFVVDGCWSSSSSGSSIWRQPDIIVRSRPWRFVTCAAETTITGPSITFFNCSLIWVNNRVCPAISFPHHQQRNPIRILPARITALGILSPFSFVRASLTYSESSVVIRSWNVPRISWY